MITNTQAPLTPPNFIGTPRRQRGERSRSASNTRGRKRAVKKDDVIDIEITPPIEPSIPTIRNIGMEEIRIKREASVKRDDSQSRPAAKARGRPKGKAKPQLIIADAEPAKKREAVDILGGDAKNKFIEQEKKVTELPATISNNGAPPPDSGGASSSGAAPKAKAKAKAKGRPRMVQTQEVSASTVATVDTGEKYDKQKGKSLQLRQLLISLNKAMNDGDISLLDSALLQKKITEHKNSPNRKATKAIKAVLLGIYNRLAEA